jgi:hypothetical protein
MKSLIIFIAFYLYCSIAQQTTFEEAIPPVDDAILRPPKEVPVSSTVKTAPVPPMEATGVIVHDAVPPREPPMVDAVPPIPDTGFSADAVPPVDDAVPPMEARGIIVHDAVPPVDDAVPPMETKGIIVHDAVPPVDDAVPPMEARDIIVHDAVPPIDDAVPPMKTKGIIVHDAVSPPVDDSVIIRDAVPPMVDAVPPHVDAIPGTTNGLLPNGLVGNGLVPNGLIPNGLVGNGLVPNGLVGNGLVGNGLVGNGLVPNGLVGNSLIGNALVGNSLIGNSFTNNGYQINGEQVTLFGFTLSAVDSIREANPDNTLDELIPYLVHCALPPWKSWIGTLNGEETEIWGVLGLAADLDELPMLPTQQQLVSACLLSSVNYFGVHVEISTRNYPSAGATKDEMKDFKMFEGAFFGDVFSADGENKKFACQGTPTSVALDHSEDRELRRCTDPGYDCMIEVVGKCSDVCSYFIDDYGYSQCLGSDGKSYPAMNVFLDSKGNH